MDPIQKNALDQTSRFFDAHGLSPGALFVEMTRLHALVLHLEHEKHELEERIASLLLVARERELTLLRRLEPQKDVP